MLNFINCSLKKILFENTWWIFKDLKINFQFNGLEPLFKKKSAWFGEHEPINADTIYPKITLNNAYCCSYDVVWIYERELFSYYNWPQILFKSLQIMKKEGDLVLRTKDSKHITLEALKVIFDKLSCLNVEIKNQFKLTNGTVCTHFFIIKNKDISIKKDEFFLLVNKKQCINSEQLFHALQCLIKIFDFLFPIKFLYHFLSEKIKKLTLLIAYLIVYRIQIYKVKNKLK